MKDKVSVITTFYNTEKYILQAIHSINVQVVDDTFDLEYILINDCSTDQSLEYVNTYFSKVPNENIDVKIISTSENLGCGGARKFGIDHSSGNYLMFLDSYNYYINNDFVKRAHYDITSENADCVEYGFTTVDDKFKKVNFCSQNKIIIENNPNFIMNYLFGEQSVNFMAWTKIYKRSLTEVKEYDTSRTYEDIRTIPYWLYHANKYVLMNSIEINYRFNKKSIIRNNDAEMRIGTCTALLELFEFFKDDIRILKKIYERAYIDISTILNYNSTYDYFNKMSRINTEMLKYIYPNDYAKITYNIDDISEDETIKKVETNI